MERLLMNPLQKPGIILKVLAVDDVEESLIVNSLHETTRIWKNL